MLAEVQKYVGKKASVNLNGLLVDVKVVDVAVKFGHLRYKITPVSGSQEIWVESVTLK